MKQSDSITKLAEALVAAHKEIRTIGFDATNPFFKSKYATLTGILEAVRPILAAHGLAITQGSDGVHFNAAGEVVAVDVSCTLVHVSGEWMTTSLPVPVDADPIVKGSNIYRPTPQTLGSAVSYGRRYVVSALLALATDEDTDGNHPARDPRTKPAEAKPAAKPERVPSPTSGNAVTLEQAMTFPYPAKGEWKGKPMGEVPIDVVRADRAKAVTADDPKYADFIARADKVLAFAKGAEQ